MLSLKLLLRTAEVGSARVILSRTIAFKALDGKLDLNDINSQNAQERSSAALSALNALKTKAQKGGSSKAIHRHTIINKKLLVRQRLKLLFDEGSPFLEIGALAGFSMDYGDLPSAASVAGIGKVHNRYCLVMANDATVKGGTLFPISVAKQIRMQHLALLNQLPCIYLVDSGGAFLPLQAEIYPDRDHGGRTFYNEAVLSSMGIPQLAVVCGSCTAGGAYCPMMAEEVIILKKSGVIFLGGPPLVKAATGEIVSEQDLGGAEMHCSISGCTDYYAGTEEEAFELCRESVSALNIPSPSCASVYEEPLYPSSELNIISGKTSLLKNDMYKILARILDGSVLKEFKMRFGPNLITGFSLICGKMIGVLANCGVISWQEAQKGAHFIQLCEARNIPMVFLQNSGDKCKEDCSSDGYILKERAKMISAHSTAKVPKIALNVGGCFGDENFTMCGMAFEPHFVFSWPFAHTALEWVPVEKRLSVEDCNIDDGTYLKVFNNSTSAFFRASRMLLDDIIHPSDTRKILAFCLDIATSRTSHFSSLPKDAQASMRM